MVRLYASMDIKISFTAAWLGGGRETLGPEGTWKRQRTCRHKEEKKGGGTDILQ